VFVWFAVSTESTEDSTTDHPEQQSRNQMDSGKRTQKTQKGGTHRSEIFVFFCGEEWHFNLNTKVTSMSRGIWLLRAALSDGSQHSVWVQIK
jgi:hypothetical protein